MPQIINTNMASLNAQRNLNSSQNSLATALTRLSSGLRINSAKDDAAGLAISDRFTTQIRGMNQAIRNANDGISLSQTGEGALGEVSNNLQRIRELAVQSANATNSASDRAALDLEVQQRLAEIDRISSQTNFNGRKILDGSFGNATFQVGADAGQTIALSLQGSTRAGDIGGIASATSAVLGNLATGGSLELGAISNFDFSASGTTDGSVNITATTFNFGTLASAGSTGQLDIANVGATTNFAAVGVVDGINVQALTQANADFSTTLGQFDVTAGGQTVGITLSTDYTGGLGALATEVQSQLQAVDPNFAATIDGNGNLVISLNGDAGAVQISNVDAQSTAAGFVSSAGMAGGADNETIFTIDGAHTVTLTTDLLTNAGVAAEIQTQLNASAGAGAYTVGWDGANYNITNNTIGSSASTIVANNASAYTGGWDVAANLTQTDGTPALSTTNAEFDVDGINIDLTTDFADFDALAAEIGSQLNAAAPPGTTYTVSNVNNAINIVNNDGVSAVAITATGIDATLDANAVNAGFGPVAGAFTGAATFSVDGNPVTLNTNTTDEVGLADAIQSQLTGYTVTNNAGIISIVNDVAGSDAVEITAADGNAILAGIVDDVGVAGVAGGSVVLANGDFSIAVGDGSPFDFVGTYDTAQDLAAAINRELSGIAAEILPSGELKLMSTQQITISGAEAATGGVIGFDTLIVAPDIGDLSTASVTSVVNANETIMRIDSALTSVSNLRSTFGAIQNRFESTISNLTASAENMTASRSRIMDADFAMETANLTRAQILQQAGTAMLAQANQIPQNVLSLLG